MKKWLILLGYGLWGAAGFFFICGGVNPFVGAAIGLASGIVIGLIHGIDYRDAPSGSVVWAVRGTFLGAMGTVGAMVGYYFLFPGFHDDQDIIVFCAIGIVLGGIAGAVFGWYMGREREHRNLPRARAELANHEKDKECPPR